MRKRATKAAKSIRRNWKTSLCGLGVIAAGTILPPLGVSMAVATGVAGLFTGLGHLFAEDGKGE